MASSSFAEAQPKLRYRSLRYPTIASKVLMQRCATTPGAPATAAHTSGAMAASDVFSATDSTAARAMPGASRSSGSREHSHGTQPRAASSSPDSSACAIRMPVRSRLVPPSAAHSATAVASRGARLATPAATRVGGSTQTPANTAPATLLSRYKRRSHHSAY